MPIKGTSYFFFLIRINCKIDGVNELVTKKHGKNSIKSNNFVTSVIPLKDTGIFDNGYFNIELCVFPGRLKDSAKDNKLDILKSWNGSFFRNHNPSLPFDPYSDVGDGGDNLVTKNELNSQIRFSLRKGSSSNKYIELLGELYVDTLYTVPGESSDAGKRIFTNSNNTKMLIEGDSIPISEDYRTHWFDSGRVRPTPNSGSESGLINQINIANTQIYAGNSWANSYGNTLRNYKFIIYTNYNCTKIKCGSQTIDMNYKDVQQTLHSAILNMPGSNGRVAWDDTTYIYPGQGLFRYYKTWDQSGTTIRYFTELISVILPISSDVLSIPFIRV